MPYGKYSSQQRPHDAASSSRVPSIAREHPVPCRPLQPEPEDGGQVTRTGHDIRCPELHRMWVDVIEFSWTRDVATA